MQLLAVTTSTGWLRLDPRTKLLLVAVVNVAALTRAEPVSSAIAFACGAVLLASIGSWRSLTTLSLLFLGCRGVQLLGTRVLATSLWQTVGAVGFFMGNFVVVLTMGVYLVRSTGPSELVEGLRRLHAPDTVVIPLAVMLRFFPTLAEELRAVIEAVRLRRLHPGPWAALKEPLTLVEHVMVPFLASATRIGDELAAAALSRGLGSPGPRTSIADLRMRRADLVGLGMSALVAGAFVVGVR
ncbi:MAG: energy-coupling factor transporter transmembrane component T [Actinomycetia bacterium]|nr:energy-coupling factor transporter transmembrane component T [Actinomycetes bacterium]